MAQTSFKQKFFDFMNYGKGHKRWQFFVSLLIIAAFVVLWQWLGI